MKKILISAVLFAAMTAAASRTATEVTSGNAVGICSDGK